MRIPLQLPPTTVYPEHYQRHISSATDTFQYAHEYRDQHHNSVPTGNARNSTKSSRKRQFRRSPNLQAAMDRIQMRREREHPTIVEDHYYDDKQRHESQYYHGEQRREEAGHGEMGHPTVAEDHYYGDEQRHESQYYHDEQRREEPGQVGQVIEMISQYDTILDHLVHKNQDLKQCVKGRSRYFPSEASYTTNEVLDTLEGLRLQTKKAIRSTSREQLGRLGMNRGRPNSQLRNFDAVRHHAQHKQEDPHRYFSRASRKERRGPTPTRSRPDPHFVPPVIQIGDRPSTKRVDFAPDERHNERASFDRRTINTQEKTQHLGETMEGYKGSAHQNHMRMPRSISAPRDTKRRTTGSREMLHSYGRDFRGPLANHRGGQQDRSRITSHYPSRNTYSPAQRSPQEHQRYNDTVSPRRTRRDVGEMQSPRHLDERNSRGLLQIDRRNTSAENGYRETVEDAEREYFISESYPNDATPSNKLSQLLPERIPPRIQESRDRISEFRNRKLMASYDPAMRHDLMEIARETITRSPQRVGFRDPVDLNNRDDPRNRRDEAIQWRDEAAHLRYQPRKNEVGHDRFVNPQLLTPRFGSPRKPREIHGAGSPDSVIRLDDLPSPQNEPFLPISPSRNHVSPMSRLYSEERESPDLSITHSEQARRLKRQVDKVYTYSKELGASQVQMKEDLYKIKDLYQSRSGSLQNRALALAKSNSLEMKGSDQIQPPGFHGDVHPLDLRPAIDLSSDSDDDVQHFDPDRTFLPPHQRSPNKQRIGSQRRSRQKSQSNKCEIGLVEIAADARRQHQKSSTRYPMEPIEGKVSPIETSDEENGESGDSSGDSSGSNIESSTKALQQLQEKFEILSKSEPSNEMEREFLRFVSNSLISSSDSSKEAAKTPQDKIQPNLDILNVSIDDDESRVARAKERLSAEPPFLSPMERDGDCRGPCPGPCPGPSTSTMIKPQSTQLGCIAIPCLSHRTHAEF